MRLRSLALLLLLPPAFLLAQKKDKHGDDPRAGYDKAARATVLHTANVYATADAGTPPITTVTPGHEIVINQRNEPWLNVLLYGSAAEFEAQAMQPHAPTGAAKAAQLLYRRVADYFPNSPQAAEALFRSADIRWQLDKLDISTLPSAHEQEAYLRPQLFEGEFKQLMKRYPDSPFAARAAFDLIDNKLCGDWQGLPKCPEMEANLYLKYADRYPGGPKSAEALYDAAYRQGVLVTMFTVDDNRKQADAAAKNCQSIADELRTRYPQSDFAARAQSIAFRVAQGIPIYGSDRD